jgi:hypothetical protein
LEAHKRQPVIEKRFEQAKSVHEIAPVLLENEARVEALFFLYFIALLVQALIERELRLAMARNTIEELPLSGGTLLASTDGRTGLPPVLPDFAARPLAGRGGRPGLRARLHRPAEPSPRPARSSALSPSRIDLTHDRSFQVIHDLWPRRSAECGSSHLSAAESKSPILRFYRRALGDLSGIQERSEHQLCACSLGVFIFGLSFVRARSSSSSRSAPDGPARPRVARRLSP